MPFSGQQIQRLCMSCDANNGDILRITADPLRDDIYVLAPKAETRFSAVCRNYNGHLVTQGSDISAEDNTNQRGRARN